MEFKITFIKNEDSSKEFWEKMGFIKEFDNQMSNDCRMIKKINIKQ